MRCWHKECESRPDPSQILETLDEFCELISACPVIPVMNVTLTDRCKRDDRIRHKLSITSRSSKA